MSRNLCIGAAGGGQGPVRCPGSGRALALGEYPATRPLSATA